MRQLRIVKANLLTSTVFHPRAGTSQMEKKESVALGYCYLSKILSDILTPLAF